MSDECCTTSIAYEPPPTPPVLPDMGGEIPWLLILPIILFIAALIWLWYLTPATVKPAEKTLREDIEAIFNQLIQDANTFKRDEAVGPLTSAQRKVADALRKHKQDK